MIALKFLSYITLRYLRSKVGIKVLSISPEYVQPVFMGTVLNDEGVKW